MHLSNILQCYDVLKGLNFAALKGGFTASPIAFLNAIIEDVQESNKELWIVFQDMAKAFDSIDLNPLTYALKQIRLQWLCCR